MNKTADQLINEISDALAEAEPGFIGRIASLVLSQPYRHIGTASDGVTDEYEPFDGHEAPSAILHREHDHNPVYLGAACPPKATPYTLPELWAEWQQAEPQADADSQFVDWLIEQKGWAPTEVNLDFFAT